MNKIQTAIIVIAFVVVVASITAGVWYCKTKQYVPDKNGMVYSQTDTIYSCRYESGGSMNGELTEAEIYLKDNGEVWLEYHYRHPVGTDKGDITREYQIDAKAIKDIREVCKKYGVLGWGKLKRSDILVLDGATDIIALKFADKEYYSVNSGLELPDGGEKIFDEIFETMKMYMQGDD